MKDIEALQRYFQNEVDTAAHAFYAWKSINNIAFNDKSIHSEMNENSVAWNAILHSLQTTFLVTLGRIFDIDRGALSIHTFLNKCLSEREQFGREGLRRRKIKLVGGNEPEWLEEYLNNAQYPRAEEFRRLKIQTKPFSKKYEEIYKPIRHKLIAHKEIDSINKVGEYFEKTNITEIINMLNFINGVSMVVMQWYINGKRTLIEDHRYTESETVEKSIQGLLAKICI